MYFPSVFWQDAVISEVFVRNIEGEEKGFKRLPLHGLCRISAEVPVVFLLAKVIVGKGKGTDRVSHRESLGGGQDSA